MALHYSDGSYVGGFPAFIGGLIGVAICLGLVSSGLNIFLSLLIGAGIPIGVMALINNTAQNYCEDIIGKWEVAGPTIEFSEEQPIDTWEFKNDGTMIWYGRGCGKSYKYEIKGKFIVIEGEKKFKIESLHKGVIMRVAYRKNNMPFFLNYRKKY